MYDFICITVDVSSDTAVSLGIKRYGTRPKIGEWVSLNVDKEETFFEVVMIVHHHNNRSDLYVKRLGDHREAIKKICKQSS
ncbi:hypothetical protein [Endozoicomonas sp.]|uniref:hypothetical protein n=1 Tax=Endozoicomonas sp. TaxID=1892382 RepID=UPI00288657E3|nr:hypothetical protein [Endozoicomonas sp.]